MRPRPRMFGNENPAMSGMDLRAGAGMDQANVLPKKLAKGSGKARKESLGSARRAAAQRMKSQGGSREI